MVRLLSLVLVLACALAFPGCSRVEILYRQAHWMATHYVADFVELSGAQRERLEGDLRDLLAWSCREQLPALGALIGEFDLDVAEGPLDPGGVQAYGERVEALGGGLIQHAIPLAARFLTDLTPAQVNGLYRSLEENNADAERKIRRATEAEVATEYAQTATDQIERWLGGLNPEQTGVVAAWARAFEPLGLVGLDFRRAQAAQLRPSIERCRTDPGCLEPVLRTTLAQLNAARSPDHRAMLAHNREISWSMVAAVVSGADAEQRRYLHRYATGLRADLAGIRCGR